MSTQTLSGAGLGSSVQVSVKQGAPTGAGRLLDLARAPLCRQTPLTPTPRGRLEHCLAWPQQGAAMSTCQGHRFRTPHHQRVLDLVYPTP